MRTWMRRGIPAALLAGGVLAMTAGNAAAVPAPIGDPTGVADTALKLADIVGHKGLPPLPFASQLELPAMPIGQSQRSFAPAPLDGGLSLSNVQFNGQDLPKPALPDLPALPSLGGDQQRSIDPSHIAISDLPQLQQLPKVPGVAGLPVSVLPDVSTARSLPNLTYSGVVPTGGLHSLTKVPDLSTVSELTQLSNPAQLPDVPAVPLGDEQRSLPGVDLLGSLPVGGLLGGAAAERELPAVPALPKLPLALPGVPAARDLPGLPQIPLALPGLGGQRSLPGLDVLNTLPLGGLLNVAGTERSLPGLDLLSTLPVGGLLGGAAAERSLPGVDLLGTLPLGGLLGGAAVERDLPGLGLLGSLPLGGLPGGAAAARELPALPGLEMVFGLIKSTPVAALLANTPLSSVAGRSLPGLGSLPLAGLLGGGVPAMTDTDSDAADTDTVDTDARSLPGIPALPKLPGLNSLPGVPADAASTDATATAGTGARALPVVDSLLPKLPLAVPAVPGASVSGLHGVPALGPSFTTTMPANDSARSIVPGVPSTAGVLGGVLGHAPRLPISGI